jgi:hypothetical protein
MPVSQRLVPALAHACRVPIKPVLSGCLSVCSMQQFENRCTNSSETWYRKMLRKIIHALKLLFRSDSSGDGFKQTQAYVPVLHSQRIRSVRMPNSCGRPL